MQFQFKATEVCEEIGLIFLVGLRSAQEIYTSKTGSEVGFYIPNVPRR